MTGAEALVRAAARAGVEVCFSNPGTTELPLVCALDAVEGVRAVLGLFEGVCTGAADGYGRMLSRPAMTLLHLGPGLAHGISNLHNARRAGTPVLNIVGEHASWHRPFDPPLTMDIEALAGTVSGWQRTVRSAAAVARDTLEAIGQAMRGRIATLIVPQDVQWASCEPDLDRVPGPSFDPVDEGAVREGVEFLSCPGKRAALILGGRALRGPGLRAAAAIRAATGCDLLCETFPAHLERGEGLPDLVRIPYVPEMAKGVLERYDRILLAGAREPIAFFGYQGQGSRLLSAHQAASRLGEEGNDTQEVLAALAEACRRGRSRGANPPQEEPPRSRPPLPTGQLDPYAVCAVVAALQPEGAIVVEEGITGTLMYYGLTAGCPAFSLLTLTGGAIGQGPACSVGAAHACPDRPVINLEADGSALYTVQSLWTQAREGLHVVTVVFANRTYEILRLELARAGVLEPGRNAKALTELGTIDWVKVGESYGVPSVRVRTAEDLAREFSRALGTEGPTLIEVPL